MTALYPRGRLRCNAGHLLTDDNVDSHSDGRRRCRICRRNRENRYRKKKQTRVCLSVSAEAALLLDQLASKADIPRTRWVEHTIRAAAKLAGITLAPGELNAFKNRVKSKYNSADEERRRLAEEAFGTVRFSG